MSELNLDVAKPIRVAHYTRTNQFGFEETLDMGVEWQHFTYANLTAPVQFQAYNPAFADKGGARIPQNATLAVDLADELMQQAFCLMSYALWLKAWSEPFIDNYELVEGKLSLVKRSLAELGATVTEVSLEEFAKNFTGGK